MRGKSDHNYLLALGRVCKVYLLQPALLCEIIALGGNGVQRAVGRAVSQQLGWDLGERPWWYRLQVQSQLTTCSMHIS